MWSGYRQSSFARPGGDCVDVLRRDREGNEARVGEFAEVPVVFRTGLGWIRRNDLQIVTRSEREKRVASSSTRVNAANRGPHTRTLFYPVDAAVEIGHSDKEVIDGRRDWLEFLGHGEK